MKVTLMAAGAAVLTLLLVGGGAEGAARLITGAQIKNSSVTGADIKNKSLTPADFKGSVEGKAGPAGPAGPTGPAGPAIVNALTRVPGDAVQVAPGAAAQSTATCPAGQGVVSGGFISSGSGSVTAADTFGATNTWTVILDNIEALVAADVQSVAYCSPSNQAAAPRAKVRAAIAAALAAATSG
jgi:hypothetical protein